jgi:lipid-binding SYLF domain-containing protein
MAARPATRAARRARLPIALALCLCVPACASIPGDTAEEKAITVEELERKTLADLEAQEPGTKEELAACVGYVIMNNKLTKIPLVGVGAGYGVAVDARTNARTYLRMRRFDLGAGVGVRAIRVVMIFQDEARFRDFIEGGFDAKIGAEATAKVGDKGAAGDSAGAPPDTSSAGAAGDSVPDEQADSAGAPPATGSDSGYTSYMLTDKGASATATFAIIRVKQVKI